MPRKSVFFLNLNSEHPFCLLGHIILYVHVLYPPDGVYWCIDQVTAQYINTNSLSIFTRALST